jgi:hypothetical protein
MDAENVKWRLNVVQFFSSFIDERSIERDMAAAEPDTVKWNVLAFASQTNVNSRDAW